ncbi:hypothetical protein CDAR_37881 [Caerostris darwini]|uniref:Secreted protein n=1 Tax=Caerostris darwini TaxID=1538125 RepID=A0AAV4T5W0_9ARAC|nr:hypothetical protein CDAR_37881 [Caerostris darwini]
MGVEARFAILVFLEFLGGIVCGAQIGPVYRAVCGQPSVKAAAQFPKWPWITEGKFSGCATYDTSEPFRIPEIPRHYTLQWHAWCSPFLAERHLLRNSPSITLASASTYGSVCVQHTYENLL